MSKHPHIVTLSTPLTVNKLVPGGQGITTLPSGQKIFLWNALPGENVSTYEIHKSKSHYLEATAIKIATPSPHRIQPADDCYLATSPWQILDYDYEIHQKSLILLETFRQQGIDISTFTTTPLTDHRPLHYRNKMEYSLYWDNETEKISLAFHRRGTHIKLPITTSSLEKSEIFRYAEEIVADLNAQKEPAREYQSLLLRASQNGTVSGGLLVKNQPHPTFPPLTDHILNHPYTYSVTGFFQINLPVYELALTEIAQHIQTNKVLDLYAGVGTIGLSVARDHDLTLVEVNPAAFSELEKNCQAVAETPLSPNYITLSSKSQGFKQKEGLHSLSKNRRLLSARGKSQGSEQKERSRPFSAPPTPILAPSEKSLDFIAPDTTVILDPPRAGCDPALITRLLEATPPTIIYLSCNPITQARDVKILLDKYRITTLQSYNFFPRTPHLENLIVLQLS